MGSLHTLSAPPPALFVTGDESPVTNAYFAVTIDAAVDLLDAPEYQDLQRAQRLAQAHAEQQGFLDEFLDPALGAALDLRIIVNPRETTPVSIALIGRVWGSAAVTARAEKLRRQVTAALPRHVTGTPVADAHEVARLLQPFPGTPVECAVITRQELICHPNRPDAGVKYYYSAVPFTWSDNDWSTVYSALAASPVPVVLSVAVLPMPVPAQFRQTLRTLATFYGRMAREGEIRAGFYQASQRLAPDAFAVDAEKTFHDFSRRLAQQAYALRIQLSAAGQLPPGLVDTIAGIISPAQPAGSFVEKQHATAAAYEVRRPASFPERRLAEYNLNVIDFRMLTGRREIWSRPDPPDPQLAMLSVLGDARDASCAFRFPIAVDGIVPGFPVRRGQAGRFGQAGPGGPGGGPAGQFGQFGPSSQSGQFGQAEADPADGTVPVLRLGTAAGPIAGPAVGTAVDTAAGAGRDIVLPVQSLARHALITGSAGSGKTSTARELLRQLWAEHHVPFLVIEPVNAGTDDYRTLAGEPGFDALEIITAGDEDGRPLRFNPFEVPAGVLVGEHAANLLGCFAAAFGLGGPLPSVYQDALSLTYLRSGFLSTERPDGAKRTWPTAVEFLAAMREVTAGRADTGEIGADVAAATVRRAARLVRGSCGSVFLTDRANDVGRLLDHPVILELKSLGPGDEQALLTALLLAATTEHAQSVRGATAELAHVTVIEAAHRLLARAPSANPAADAQAKEQAAAFANTLAANRKHGAGVIIVEQAPGTLVADAVKNTGLKIIHRLTADDDRRYLGETMGMDAHQRLLAPRLRPGEALLYRDDFAEPGHVRVGRTGPAQAGPAQAGPAGAVRPAAAPPFGACDRCRAHCDYRGAALAMLDDPRIVAGLGQATDAAEQPGATPTEQPGLTPAEQQSALLELAGTLFATVGRFAALPSAPPGRNDAAYCLLLHALATQSPRTAGQWPEAGARLLGITGEVAEETREAGRPGQLGRAGEAAGAGLADGLLAAASRAARQLGTGAGALGSGAGLATGGGGATETARGSRDEGPHDPLADR